MTIQRVSENIFHKCVACVCARVDHWVVANFPCRFHFPFFYSARTHSFTCAISWWSRRGRYRIRRVVDEKPIAEKRKMPKQLLHSNKNGFRIGRFFFFFFDVIVGCCRCCCCDSCRQWHAALTIRMCVHACVCVSERDALDVNVDVPRIDKKQTNKQWGEKIKLEIKLTAHRANTHTHRNTSSYTDRPYSARTYVSTPSH